MNKTKLYTRVYKENQQFLCYSCSNHKGKEKEFLFKLNETDLTRAILKTIGLMLEQIPFEEKVTVYTQNDIGIDLMYKSHMRATHKNKDLLEHILHHIVSYQKEIVFINCSLSPKLKDLQHHLSKKMSKIKRENATLSIPQVNTTSIYNDNAFASKEIAIYIRNNFNPSNQTSTSVILLKYKEVERTLFHLSNGTSNTEGLIATAIFAIQRLNTPCRITLHTPTSLGLDKYIERGYGKNSLELKKLYNILSAHNHALSVIVHKERQKELAQKLKA